MNYILIFIVAILMILVVVSLVRGIVAFLQSTKFDLEHGDDSARASEMQLRQNKMMYARIKYQALAIVVVCVIILAAR